MPYSPDIQKRNAENAGILSADFRRRYEANYAFADAVSMYQALPGLRGFWPMSSIGTTGNAYDLSGQGRTLSSGGAANVPQYHRAGLAPIASNYSTGHLTRATEAGLEITGLEPYVNITSRGLTIGGWFYPNGGAGTRRGLIGKYNFASPDRSYLLWLDTDNKFYFTVSVDGTATTQVVSTETVTLNTWYRVLGRFDPGAELALWVNDNEYTNTTSIPASISVEPSQFNVGTHNNGSASYVFDGWISMCFLCAAALTDSQIFTLYHQTRPLFGV